MSQGRTEIGEKKGHMLFLLAAEKSYKKWVKDFFPS